MRHIKIVETVPICRTKFVHLNETSYTDREGNLKNWAWAERPGVAGAVVVAACYRTPGLLDNRLVVIREFRVPLNDYEWALPAGLVNPGEDVISAAKREMKEETGLEISEIIRPPSPPIYSSAGLTNETCQIVYAQAVGTLSKGLQEASEEITVHLMPRLEVRRLLESGQKISARAYLIMDRFWIHGEI